MKTLLISALLIIMACAKKPNSEPTADPPSADPPKTMYFSKSFIVDSSAYAKIRIRFKNGTSYLAPVNGGDTARARDGYQAFMLPGAQGTSTFQLQPGKYWLEADINVWHGDWQNTPIQFTLGEDGGIYNVAGNNYLLDLVPFSSTAKNASVYNIRYYRQE